MNSRSVKYFIQLENAKKTLDTLTENMQEVRTWLDDAKELLKYIGDDAVPEDVIEETLPKLEVRFRSRVFSIWAEVVPTVGWCGAGILVTPFLCQQKTL